MEFESYADVFGKDTGLLAEKRLFLFDMDGTIYEEETIFDGTIDLLRLIRKLGGKFVFISNNSSRSVKDYIEKVNRLGIEADKDNFFTSAQAAILYLKENYPGKKIYCQGTHALVQEMRDADIDVTEEVEHGIEVVLVGFDTELTSSKIRKTCEVLGKDIPYIATNPDLRCPVSFGFIPDCGSICNMIKAATGREPIYIGKPDPVMVDIVREKLGYTKSETVVIGDRLYTDIATGLRAGVTSVCVLTGEATQKEIENGDIKPTLTFHSVRDIWKAILQFMIAGVYN